MSGGLTYDIFIKNLAQETTEAQIRELFSQLGAVHSTTLKPGNRGDNRLVGFVRFEDREVAVQALESGINEIHGVTFFKSPGLKNGHSWYTSGNKRQKDRMPQETHHGPAKGYRGHGNRRFSAEDDGAGDSERHGDIIRKEEISVSFHETPLTFWGQLCDRNTELEDLADQLQLVCPGGQSLTGPPNKDKIYAAVFEEDDRWYRCRVTKKLSDTEYEVTFIDYGNSEVKQISEIKELLANLATVKPFAQRYVLFGLKAIHDPESLGFAQGCDKLLELTEEKVLTASVCNVRVSGYIPIILHAEDQEINQIMVSEGFAELANPRSQRTNADHSSGRNHANGDGHAPPGFERHKKFGRHKNGTDGGAMSDNSWASASSRVEHAAGDAHQWSARQSGGAAAAATGEDGGRLRQELQQALATNQQLSQKIQQMKDASQEVVALRREWDATTLELESTKVKMSQLQTEYTDLVAKQAEWSLSLKLSKLIQSVNKVKVFRIQFPTEEHCPDPIEEAFSVASDSDRITTGDLPSGKVVEKALSIYHTTQNAIRAAENVEEVTDLIGGRDEARSSLHSALLEFVNVTGQLPLATRAKKVEEVLKIICSRYKEFLVRDATTADSVVFDDALKKYREWKLQRVGEFQDARTQTNTCHNGISSAFRILHQQLSLEGEVTDDNLSTTANLDQLLDNLQEAVDRETEKTNLVLDVNESDRLVVGSLLRSLEAELRRELADIAHLQQLASDHGDLATKLTPWLEARPDTSALEAVRRSIKTLKSKLRHKLADLQDLVEGEDSASGDITELKDEMNALRLQLHTAFQEEDGILANLAELNENHFPELTLQHPSYGIEMIKQYNGMVKQNRALDQFDLEPMPNTTKEVVHKTVFGGKKVVLKEYIIDESIGVKKADFLRRAVAYNKIVSQHILPIDALFFTTNGRQAYVQLPYLQKNLTTLVEESPPSPEDTFQILRDVLTGLQAIHQAHQVFGALHPNNVLINEQGQGVLAEIDCSKAPQQRASAFTTSSGLCFQPPEFHKQEISWASDMYNFGLLALWLHFPTHKFSVKPSGVPDLSGIKKEWGLEELLWNIVQEEPASRCTANKTAAMSYFTHSPHAKNTSGRDQEETLQLRPKTEGRQSNGKNGGILKNRDALSPTSSPVFSPQATSPDRSPSPDTSPGGSAREVLKEPVEIDLTGTCNEGDYQNGIVEETDEWDETEEMQQEDEDTNEQTEEDGVEQEEYGDEPERAADVSADCIVNVTSAESTPVLVCSTQGTPVNTPVEADSNDSGTTGLVQDAVLQASKLAAMAPLIQEDNEDDGGWEQCNSGATAEEHEESSNAPS